MTKRAEAERDDALRLLWQVQAEREEARKALRIVVEAFKHWNQTAWAIGGGRDNAERFAALAQATEDARYLLEKQS